MLVQILCLLPCEYSLVFVLTASSDLVFPHPPLVQHLQPNSDNLQPISILNPEVN